MHTVVLALAKLGGWRDTKRTGRIGWQPLWRGWTQLETLVDGWRLARSDECDRGVCAVGLLQTRHTFGKRMVYRARDTRLNRPVVLKVLKSRTSWPARPPDGAGRRSHAPRIVVRATNTVLTLAVR